MPIRAGQLRKRITIEAPAGMRDPAGEKIPTWQPVVTVWAAIEPNAGGVREQFQAAQIFASASHRIRMRKQAGVTITPAMRVVYDGRQFDINGTVDVDERGKEVFIFATEKQGAVVQMDSHARGGL